MSAGKRVGSPQSPQMNVCFRLFLTLALVLSACLTGPGLAGAQTPLPAATANHPLTATAWRLVKFQSSDGSELQPGAAQYQIHFRSEGRVNVRLDCNRGTGTWTSAGPNQLTFGPLALTRAACAPTPLNARVARDFGYIRSYVMKNGHLFLALFADGGIYEYAPVPVQAPTR